MENTRKIYITVALEILRDANEQEVIAECDYTFEHADIVDTEILGEVEDWVKDYGWHWFNYQLQHSINKHTEEQTNGYDEHSGW